MPPWRLPPRLLPRERSRSRRPPSGVLTAISRWTTSGSRLRRRRSPTTSTRIRVTAPSATAATDGDDQELARTTKKKGFIGKPSPRDIPGICAKCHSDAAVMKQFNASLRVDQLSEYKTSGHGKKLAQGETATSPSARAATAPTASSRSRTRALPSPQKVAETCNGCHGDKALMESDKLLEPTSTRSGRGHHHQVRVEKGDLSAPTCNSCHGNHGAAPPGGRIGRQRLGTCHSVFAEKFRGSARTGSLSKR